MPKISILVPTRNYGHFIAKTLDSILSQDYTDFEVIISDNASTDHTADIVRDYQAKDARIRYVQQTTDLGMVGNWDWCMNAAQGEYIKFLFADDALAANDSLSRYIAPMEAHADIQLVASARQCIDAHDAPLQILQSWEKSAIFDGARIMRTCLREDTNLLGEPSAVMFRKCAVQRNFDNNYRQLVDLEMWLHLCQQGKVAYISTPLCLFRFHDAQQTAMNLGQSATRAENIQLFLDYLPALNTQANSLLAKLDNCFMLSYYYNKLRKLSPHTEREQKLHLAFDLHNHLIKRTFCQVVYRFYRPIWNLQRSLGKLRV